MEKPQHPGHIIRLKGSRSTPPAASGNTQNLTTFSAGSSCVILGKEQKGTVWVQLQQGTGGSLARLLPAHTLLTSPQSQLAPCSFMFPWLFPAIFQQIHEAERARPQLP